ncbi:hypothetical protein Tco_0290386 [Tanacetum coccineum]
MKDKMVYKWNNVVGSLMNVPIFVGTFSVVTDLAVLENMDAYRDEGMGDIIFGEPFLREVGIKTKWFEGIITIDDINVFTQLINTAYPLPLDTAYRSSGTESESKNELSERLIEVEEQQKVNICEQLDDTWAWVAMGPERQPDAAAGAPAVAEDAPAVDEGDQAVPAPVQAPQQPPPPPPAAARTMP